MVLEDEALVRISRLAADDERVEALLAQLPAEQAQAVRARVMMSATTARSRLSCAARRAWCVNG